MKVLLLLSFCCSMFSGLAQRTLVPNTGVSMIPPPGFVKSDNYNGFQNDKASSSIIVIELPGALKEVTAGFNTERMSQQGINLLSSESIKLKKDSAIIYQVMQKDSVGNTFYKEVLVFGDDKHTVLINGIYPSTSKSISKSLHQSLLSVTYQATSLSAGVALRFEVNVTGLGFILTSAANNSLVYTRDGEIPTKSLDKASFVIARSTSEVSISDQHEFALRRLHQLPNGQLLEVKATNEIMIDSLKGVELIATTKDMELTYQSILFMDKGYFILYGYSKQQSPQSIATFQKIAYSFKRKK